MRCHMNDENSEQQIYIYIYIYIQGKSLATGCKLLSIKNYAIEIMT